MGESEKRAPLLAMVSTDIRRDLIAPLRELREWRLVHFYRRASYGDLSPDELDASLRLYRSPWGLFRGLLRARPDLVQGVEPFAVRLLPYLYAVWLAAVVRRVPLVLVTLENRPLVEKHGPLFSRLLRLALWPVFRTARRIIVLNEGARRNVLNVGRFETKLQRLMYGTWGVDPDEFTPVCNGREPDWGAGPVLLFIGRLHAEKGVFDLLDAFASVRAAYPTARLVLIGEGPARPELERRIATRGWDREGAVLMTGTRKNRDLPPLLRAATVFVAPSVTTRAWEEQVGMTNLQAMACGVPVISTRSGAIPEYVPDGVAGLLVPEGDPQALAEALLALLGDEARCRALGQAGRAYSLAHYDARANLQRAEAVLLKVLAEARGQKG